MELVLFWCFTNKQTEFFILRKGQKDNKLKWNVVMTDKTLATVERLLIFVHRETRGTGTNALTPDVPD